MFCIAISVTKGNAVEHIHTKDCNHRISHLQKLTLVRVDIMENEKSIMYFVDYMMR